MDLSKVWNTKPPRRPFARELAEAKEKARKRLEHGQADPRMTPRVFPGAPPLP